MIDTETLEQARRQFLRGSAADRIALVSANLRRVASDLADATTLDATRRLVDETARLCEWAAADIAEADLQAAVLDGGRLMARCRVGWVDLQASAELRRWVARDVRTIGASVALAAAPGARRVS